MESKSPFTKEDIDALYFQCRPGILFSTFFLVTSVLLLIFLPGKENIIAFSIGIVFTGLVILFTMGKLIIDINGDFKIEEIKYIQSKEQKQDYEAGSGEPSSGAQMNEYVAFHIVIDNERYRVDKEFWDQCDTGDEVIFHIAPKSKHRIRMILKKTNTQNLVF